MVSTVLTVEEEEYSSLMKVKTFHRNILPHIRPIGATFFITTRLDDALPRHIIRELKEAFEKEKTDIIQSHPNDYEERLYDASKRHFGKYDHQLDEKPYGECYLKNPDVAHIIMEKLKEMDEHYFELQAYCIMPNHLHLLINTSIQLLGTDIDESNLDDRYIQLDKTMKHFKGATSYLSNQALGRKGKFWQRDSYDHYVRNDKEWDNIVNYILNNPVKAKLAQTSLDWKYSYYRYA